jgi:predicted metal-dependent hydrolase
VFPSGEDFFVRSVRAFRADITDPVLAQQVKHFIGQEAIHGREHRQLNERLHELGYRTRRIDLICDRLLKTRSRVKGNRHNLAITAAMEHLTAVAGEVLLADTDLRAFIDHDGVTSVFLWHALEECEHKSVAFDVYRSVGGTEKMRRSGMNAAMSMLVSYLVWEIIVTVIADGNARRNPVRVLRDLRRFWSSPLFRATTWARIRAYYRPGFHPTDIETDALVERAREELFGPHGTLSGYLPAQVQPEPEPVKPEPVKQGAPR